MGPQSSHAFLCSLSQKPSACVLRVARWVHGSQEPLSHRCSPRHWCLYLSFLVRGPMSYSQCSILRRAELSTKNLLARCVSGWQHPCPTGRTQCQGRPSWLPTPVNLCSRVCRDLSHRRSQKGNWEPEFRHCHWLSDICMDRVSMES